MENINDSIIETQKAWSWSDEEIAKVRDLLNEGEIVAAPTDTIWGLFIYSKKARDLEKLRELKERDRDKPFILFLPQASLAFEHIILPEEIDKSFLEKNWSSKLSLIFDLKENSGLKQSCDYQSIGIRIPNLMAWKKIMQELQFNGGFLFCSSANISGQAVVESIEQARQLFEHKVKLVVPEEREFSGRASTVIDLRLSNNKAFTVPERVLRGEINHDWWEKLFL